MLLFNSRLRLFLGKLKSKWLGPFEITKILPYRAVDIMHLEKRTFKVNRQRLNQYYVGDISMKTIVLLLNIRKVKE